MKSHAHNNGYGAYDDGESITHNPFHPDEERRQWEEWRQGWINAEADARRAASAEDDQS